MVNEHTLTMNQADFESFKAKFVAQGSGYEVVLDEASGNVTIIWID